MTKVIITQKKCFVKPFYHFTKSARKMDKKPVPAGREEAEIHGSISEWICTDERERKESIELPKKSKIQKYSSFL